MVLQMAVTSHEYSNKLYKTQTKFVYYISAESVTLDFYVFFFNPFAEKLTSSTLTKTDL